MNQELYNIIKQAYEFYDQNDKVYQPKINEYQQNLKLLKMRYDYEPQYSPPSFPWIIFIVSLFLLFPYCSISVLIYYYVKLSKQKKEFQEKLKNFNRAKHQKEIAQQIDFNQQLLNEIVVKRNTHYYSCINCINFIPKHYRYTKTLSSLMHYVKNGMATTLDEACYYHSLELRDLDASRAKAEAEELAKKEEERRHNETISALDRNNTNQEKIINELEKNREHFRRW